MPLRNLQRIKLIKLFKVKLKEKLSIDDLINWIVGVLRQVYINESEYTQFVIPEILSESEYKAFVIDYINAVLLDVLIKDLIYCKLRIPSENIKLKEVHKECFFNIMSTNDKLKEKNNYSNFDKKYEQFFVQDHLFKPQDFELEDDIHNTLNCPYHYLLYGMINHAEANPLGKLEGKVSAKKSLTYFNDISKIILSNPDKLMALEEMYAFSKISQIPWFYHFSNYLSEWSIDSGNSIAEIDVSGAIYKKLSKNTKKLLLLDNHFNSQQIVLNYLFGSIVNGSSVEEFLKYIDECSTFLLAQCYKISAMMDTYLWVAFRRWFLNDYSKIYTYISQSSILKNIYSDMQNTWFILKFSGSNNEDANAIFEKFYRTFFLE